MDNAQRIWDILMSEVKNAYGVAGIMGNLKAESSLNCMSLTGKNIPKEYWTKVQDGTITKEQFSHDSIAVGLAQWRYFSRKASLYQFGIPRGLLLTGVETQTRFLLSEMRTYKSVWSTVCNAKSVKEASDIVMLKYEKPAGTSEAAKKKRADYGVDYFNRFAQDLPDPEPTPSPVPTQKKKVYLTADKVIIRKGNGTGYGIITRIEKKADGIFDYVATADNGWNAVVYQKVVGWISGDFSEVR